MRKVIVTLGVLLLSIAAVAQDNVPKGEIFGGYSYMRQKIESALSPIGLDHVNANGWMAGAAVFPSPWFGIKGEVNGVYARPNINLSSLGVPGVAGVELRNDVYTYTFGPVIAYRKGTRVQPFGHALFGAAHRKASVGTTILGFTIPANIGSDTAFAMQLGGGADLVVSPRFALRGQADWLRTRFSGLLNDNQDNFKASAGIVFRFGGH